jgi:hypothetical protein
VAHNAAHKGKPTISGTAFCCVIQTRIDAVWQTLHQQKCSGGRSLEMGWW